MAADLQALLSTLACEPEAAVVKGPCSYYHYLCDGVDDRGWGCGYRSLQTMCSFAVAAKGVGPVTLAPDERVPSISKIQETLAKVGDKPSSFVGSKEWIGTVEAAMVMDELLSVQCRLLHLAPGGSPAHVETALHSHFRKNGAPVMIGGDVDNASKTLVGIVLGNSIQATKLLIADPHFIADNSDCGIIPIQWVDTRKIVNPNSFYNFCVPLVYTSVIGDVSIQSVRKDDVTKLAGVFLHMNGRNWCQQLLFLSNLHDSHPYYRQRCVLEAWHICTEHLTMNRDEGSLPSEYNSSICQLRPAAV